MKKLFVLIWVFLLVALTAIYSFGADGSVGTGKRSASAVIYSGSCYITKIHAMSDGTGDVTVDVYNGSNAATVATGDMLTSLFIASGSRSAEESWGFPRLCYGGIYVLLTGSAGSYIVDYTTQ